MVSLDTGDAFFMTQGAIFFQPRELNVSLADDVIEAFDELVLFSVFRIALVCKQRMGICQELFFPEADLRGMRLVLAGYLIRGLNFLYCLKRGLRLLMGGE